MHSKSAVLFKVLLNRFHPGSDKSLLKYLSKEETQEIVTQNITADDPAFVLDWKQDVIFRTHYSWLAPIIQQMPTSLQGPMVAALPERQSARLKTFLKFKSYPKSLPTTLKNFLINQLFQKWDPKGVVPREYLPPSNLSALLDFSKGQLVDFIDMLAMHDLADALRHIVDKKNLKRIYQHLPQKNQQYLRLCLHQKEKIATPKLEIEKWNGDPQQLEALLHRRGIFRLGKALCGQDPQFVWHLTHILDTGRGTTIAKYYQENVIPKITPYLVQQLQSAINFLKKKSAP